MFATVHNFRHYVIVLILVLFKTPDISWGFSFQRTESYLQQARNMKLGKHRQWIKLGHYKNSLLGYRSGFREGFFIDPEGYKSPELELERSIRLLYSEAEEFQRIFKQHPQCFYLARAQWLNQILNVTSEDRVSCAERDEWKRQLNVESISLIFASGDLSNAASIFGHTFLKLNNPTNTGHKDLVDYGVDYSAAADDIKGFLYAFKGLFGFYNGQFAMLPYHQKILEYTNVEGRDLWEYRLNFSKAEVDFLINHLLELENARAPYYFADDNCSTQILRTLEAVRPELNMIDEIKNFVVPVDTVKLVARSPNLVEAVKYKASLKTEFVQTYRLLNKEQKDFFPQLLKNLNFNSTLTDFSKDEKSELLEAAAAALSLEAFKKSQNLENEKYKLYLQRIELGQGEAKKIRREFTPPSNTHDSAALSIGVQENSTIIRLRTAFHELEQPHDGLIPHSHIEAIAFSLRHVRTNNKLYFDRFTLLSLINLNLSNSLENNLAWKARVDFLDRGRVDLEGGLGGSYSVDMNDSLRFSTFLTARTWPNEIKQLLGLGPELLFSYHPFQPFGLSWGSTYFVINQHQDYWRNRVRMNWQINSHWSLQSEFENLIAPERGMQNKGLMNVRAVYNFIF